MRSLERDTIVSISPTPAQVGQQIEGARDEDAAPEGVRAPFDRETASRRGAKAMSRLATRAT